MVNGLHQLWRSVEHDERYQSADTPTRLAYFDKFITGVRQQHGDQVFGLQGFAQNVRQRIEQPQKKLSFGESFRHGLAEDAFFTQLGAMFDQDDVDDGQVQQFLNAEYEARVEKGEPVTGFLGELAGGIAPYAASAGAGAYVGSKAGPYGAAAGAAATGFAKDAVTEPVRNIALNYWSLLDQGAPPEEAFTKAFTTGKWEGAAVASTNVIPGGKLLSATAKAVARLPKNAVTKGAQKALLAGTNKTGLTRAAVEVARGSSDNVLIEGGLVGAENLAGIDASSRKGGFVERTLVAGAAGMTLSGAMLAGNKLRKGSANVSRGDKFTKGIFEEENLQGLIGSIDHQIIDAEHQLRQVEGTGYADATRQQVADLKKAKTDIQTMWDIITDGTDPVPFEATNRIGKDGSDAAYDPVTNTISAFAGIYSWKGDHIQRQTLLHEAAHAHFTTLPEPVQNALYSLFATETTSRSGPLFDVDGNPRKNLSDGLASKDDEIRFQEWYAERTALKQDDWAKRKIQKSEESPTEGFISELAGDLRDKLYRIGRHIGFQDGLDASFKDFLDAGDKYAFARPANKVDVGTTATGKVPLDDPTNPAAKPVEEVPQEQAASKPTPEQPIVDPVVQEFGTADQATIQNNLKDYGDAYGPDQITARQRRQQLETRANELAEASRKRVLEEENKAARIAEQEFVRKDTTAPTTAPEGEALKKSPPQAAAPKPRKPAKLPKAADAPVQSTLSKIIAKNQGSGELTPKDRKALLDAIHKEVREDFEKRRAPDDEDPLLFSRRGGKKPEGFVSLLGTNDDRPPNVKYYVEPTGPNLWTFRQLTDEGDSGELMLRVYPEKKAAHALLTHVDREARGQGIGSKLYDAAKYELRQQGYDVLVGDVVAPQPIAIREKTFPGQNIYFKDGKEVSVEEALRTDFDAGDSVRAGSKVKPDGKKPERKLLFSKRNGTPVASLPERLRTTERGIGLQSKAHQEVLNLQQLRGSGKQILGILRKKGVKDTELNDLGLTGFLEGRDKVTRDEILEHITENQIVMFETTLGGDGASNDRRYESVDDYISEKRKGWEEFLTDAKIGDGYLSVERAKDFEEGILKNLPEEDWDEARALLVGKYLVAEEYGELPDYFDYDTINDLKSALFASEVDADRALRERVYDEVATYTDSDLLDIFGDQDIIDDIENGEQTSANHYDYTVNFGDTKAYREHLIQMELPNTERWHVANEQPFVQEAHFDEENIAVHARTILTDKVVPGRTLYVDEVQSDLHQQGREYGYNRITRDEASDKFYEDGTLKNLEQVRADISYRMTQAVDQHTQELATLRKLDDEDEFNSAYAQAVDHYTGLFSELGKLDSAVEKRIDSFKEAKLKEVGFHGFYAAPDAPFKDVKNWAGLAFKRMLRIAALEDLDAVAWNPDDVHTKRWGGRKFNTYDTVFPKLKLWKQYGLKVERGPQLTNNGSGARTVTPWLVKLTPEVKERIKKEGLPLYSRRSGAGNDKPIKPPNTRRFAERAGDVDPELSAINDRRPDIISREDDIQSVKTIKADADTKSVVELDASVQALQDARTEGEKNTAVIDSIKRMQIAQDAGDAVKTEEVFEALAKTGTTVGQMLRQYREFKAATKTKNMVQLIDMHLKLSGRKLSDAQRSRLTGLVDADIAAKSRLDAAIEASLNDPANKALVKAARAAEYKENLAYRKLINASRAVLPRSAKNIPSDLLTLIQGNLLTPVSTGRNANGNYISMFPRTVARIPAAALDAARATLFGKQRTVALPSIRELGWFLGRSAAGLRKAKDALIYGGTDDRIIGEQIKGFNPGRALYSAFSGDLPVDVNTGKVRLSDRVAKLAEGVIGAPPEAMLRSLSALDELAKEGFRGARAAEETRIRDLKPNTKEFREVQLGKDVQANAATEATALQFTYQDSSTAARIAQAIDNAAAAVPAVGPMLHFGFRLAFSPYVRTPVNLFVEGSKFAMPAFGFAHGIAKAMQGNAREAQLSFGYAMTGMMIYGLADLLTENDLLSPGPDTDKGNNLVRAESGMGYFRINISGLQRLMSDEDASYRPGDKTIRLDSLGVAGYVMAVRAEAQRLSEQNATQVPDGLLTRIGEEQLGAVIAQGRFAVNQTMLQGVRELIVALDRGETAKWVGDKVNVLSSMIMPNSVLAWRATGENELKPDLTVSGRPADTIENIINYKFGDRSQLLSKRDIFGRQIPSTPKGVNPEVYHMLDFLKINKAPDDLNAVLYALYRKTGDDRVIPSVVSDRIELQKTPMRVPREMYDSLYETVQGAKGDAFVNLASKRSWQNLAKNSPDAALNALERAYERAGLFAKKRWINENRRELMGIRKELIQYQSGR